MDTLELARTRPKSIRARIKGALLASGAALLVVSLAACAGTAPSKSDTAVTRDNTLIVGVTGALPTIDPVHAESYAGNQVNSALYERLISFDKANQIVPELATEFKVAADTKSVDVTLPSNIAFHDGTTLTSQDVAYTLDRIKRIGQGVAGLIKAYDSTTIIDDTHLTINLSRPDYSMVGALSKVWIVNSALVKSHLGDNEGQAWLQSNAAGSGPYEVSSASGAKEMVLTRFADYRQDEPGRPAAIRFKQVDLSSTLRDLVKSGQIDIAANISAIDAATLKSESDLVVATVPQLTMTVVWLNVDSGPTANIAVRRALQLAYDYQGGLDSIRLGYGTIADGIAPDAFTCRPDLATAKTDLVGARKILDDAGIKDLKLTLRYQPLSSEQTREATLLQDNLKKIGVTLELLPIAFPDWLTSLSKKETIPSMMLAGDSAQYPDLGAWMNTQYLTTAIGSTNRTGYSNPEVDGLLAKAVATADPDAACDLYKQAQEIISSDVPGLFMYSTFSPMVYAKGLSGMEADYTIRPVNFADVRLKK